MNDERGTAEVVGFVLMFALVTTSYGLYQADVVPYQNEGVELEHAQLLESEVNRVRAALASTATGEPPTSVTVDVAPRYPARAVAVNPPNPTGSVRTSGTFQVEFFGVNGTERTYWNGSKRRFSTRVLSVETDYNRLQAAPTYTLENGMAVKHYPSGKMRVAGGAVISNRTIDLVLVSGTVAESGQSIDLDARGVSTSTRFLRVNATRPPGDPNGGPSYVEIPSTMSQSEWDEVAASTSGLNRVELYCVGTSKNKTTNCPGDRFGDARLVLEQGEYDLRITKVSLDGPDQVPATYLTTPADALAGAGVGQTQNVRFVARDRFGNPVAGERVNVSLVSGQGSLTASQVTTDSEGVATVGFTATGGSQATVRASIAGGDAVYETADVDLGNSSVATMSSPNQLFDGIDPVNGLWARETTSVSTAECLDLLWSSCTRTRATEASFQYTVRNTTSGAVRDTYLVAVSLRDGDGDGTFTSTTLTNDTDPEPDDRIHVDRIRVEVYDGYTTDTLLVRADLDEAALDAIADSDRRVDLLAPESYDHDADHVAGVEPANSSELDVAADEHTHLLGSTEESHLAGMRTGPNESVDLIVNQVRGRLVVETR